MLLPGFLAQFDAGYPTAPREACDAPPEGRGEVAAGGVARRRPAGVAALDPRTETPETLPDSADFARANQSIAGAAYWMIGTDLFLATPGQVLRDARAELAVPDSAMIWSQGLLDRAKAIARERNPSVLLPPNPGPGDARVPSAWLKVVLWLTYSAAPVTLASVRFPVGVTLPEMAGESWEEAYGAVEVFRAFDPRLLARNPFAVGGIPEVNVEGDPGGGTRGPAPSESSGSGAGLVALALLAIGLAASGDGR